MENPTRIENKYSLETILEILKKKYDPEIESKLLNLYLVGSRVYQTADKNSDWDYLAITSISTTNTFSDEEELQKKVWISKKYLKFMAISAIFFIYRITLNRHFCFNQRWACLSLSMVISMFLSMKRRILKTCWSSSEFPCWSFFSCQHNVSSCKSISQNSSSMQIWSKHRGVGQHQTNMGLQKDDLAKEKSTKPKRQSIDIL